LPILNIEEFWTFDVTDGNMQEKQVYSFN